MNRHKKNQKWIIFAKEASQVPVKPLVRYLESWTRSIVEVEFEFLYPGTSTELKFQTHPFVQKIFHIFQF